MAKGIAKHSETTILKPQPGFQEQFLSCNADICIGGGAAGSGKTMSLLLDPLRYRDNGEFGAVFFRRTFPEIVRQGGPWDEACKMYPLFGAKPRVADLQWVFPSGMRVSFAHLQFDKDLHSWHGSQVPLILVDEATTFTDTSFWYLMSRNRSTCGIRPYMRLSCNPDADSWLAGFLSWWIDDEGWPIPERSGVLRYFFRVGGSLMWGDTKEELYQYIPKDIPKGTDPESLIKSVTFIPAKIYGNQELLKKDPAYLGALLALAPVDRARLLEGNWKVRAQGGNLFQADWFVPEVERAAVPPDTKFVRAWDLAASIPHKGHTDPDWTAGVLLGKSLLAGKYYVLDARRTRGTPGAVMQFIKHTAVVDGKRVKIVMEQEPSAAGKFVNAEFLRLLDGYNYKPVRPTRDKIERAGPCANQAEGGNIKIVRGAWNQLFLAEVPFLGADTGHDDVADALSLAYSQLAGPPKTAGVVSVNVARPIPKEVKRRMSPFGNVWDSPPNQVIDTGQPEPKPLGVFDV